MYSSSLIVFVFLSFFFPSSSFHSFLSALLTLIIFLYFPSFLHSSPFLVVLQSSPLFSSVPPTVSIVFPSFSIYQPVLLLACRWTAKQGDARTAHNFIENARPLSDHLGAQIKLQIFQRRSELYTISLQLFLATLDEDLEMIFYVILMMMMEIELSHTLHTNTCICWYAFVLTQKRRHTVVHKRNIQLALYMSWKLRLLLVN